VSIFAQILASILGSPANEPSARAQAPHYADLGASAPAKAPPAGSPAAPPPAVDVASVLNNLAQQADEDLDWRGSIVDLMKLLKLDSSLTSRRRLAQELGYAGSMHDTAAMNIWLHRQVMNKLAEHGGKVPSELGG